MSEHINPGQFFTLTQALSKEVLRQPAVLFWGIVFPILLAIGLGMAFTRELETVHNIGFVNYDVQFKDTQGIALDQFEALLEHLPGTGDDIHIRDGKIPFELTVEGGELGKTAYVFEPGSWGETITRLKQGRISMIMVMSDDKITYHFDPLNPSAQLAWLKLSRLMAGKGKSVTTAEIKGIDRVSFSPLDLPGTRYIDFLIPGLVSMTVMMSCMWGVSYGMIDKRSKKLLRRMVATPMIKTHFLAALVVVRIFINTVESALLVMFAWLIFDITIQGSAWTLLAVFLSGNIAFCGLAIFTSSRTANTEVGNGIINAVVMPMTLLSGVFFSYHNFPEWGIAIIEKLPLTLMVDGIRGVFIEGAGFADTAPAVFLLLLIGTVFFSAGLKIFKWH
jgi:ABC-2 type transport system permease protein